MAPRGMLNLCTQMSEGDLDAIGARYERALERLARCSSGG